jgi:hypothetical protein
MYQKLLEHKETKGYRLYVLNTLLLGRWLRRQRWISRHEILKSHIMLASMIKKV